MKEYAVVIVQKLRVIAKNRIVTKKAALEDKNEPSLNFMNTDNVRLVETLKDTVRVVEIEEKGKAPISVDMRSKIPDRILLWKAFETFQNYHKLKGDDLKLAKQAYYAGFINLRNVQHRKRETVNKQLDIAIEALTTISMLTEDSHPPYRYMPVSRMGEIAAEALERIKKKTNDMKKVMEDK